MNGTRHPRRRGARLGAAAGVAALSLAAAACAGAGGSSGGSQHTIHVLMVNNPQMVDLEHMTRQYFTKQTGIKVDFTVLPEDDLRDKASQEFSSQAGQYDVATLSNFEIPFYSKNGWLVPLNSFLGSDPGFDQADILKPIAQSLTGADGKLYGEPFYGESSFLMYRTDVFAAKHLTMPAHPTWQQVATLASQVNGAEPGMRGICLRGQPGWGEVWAPLTTVVNTFGGTWFDKNWSAQATAPPFRNAVNFYVNLVRQYGEPGASQSGFTECLNNFGQGKTAMWYDATSAAGSLEAPGSPVAGKVGFVPAPVVATQSSGWLYSWAWAIEKASKNQQDAWKFLSWASGKQYIQLDGQHSGWAGIPPGTRTSTYSNPQYLKVASAFAQPTLTAINSTNPSNPGVQPRPTPGIQFVDIPEFTDFGTTTSQLISQAIAGQISVSSALSQTQNLAQTAGNKHKGH
jgi:sorbitol/mannitol transport system substrate-binding protein